MIIKRRGLPLSELLPFSTSKPGGWRRDRGGGGSDLPESPADGGGEETVDDRVGRGIERRQRLYERRYREVRLSLRNMSVHL